MRDFKKVREVAGSTVVTLPQAILESIGLRLGDRVIVEAAPPRRIVITKEGPTMQSVARLELELELLEKQRQAQDSDLAYKRQQYEKSMPCDEGMGDPDVAILVMSEVARDRDRFDFEIAQKRLEIYDVQGGEVPPDADDGEVKPAREAQGDTEAADTAGTHAAQILNAAVALAGADGEEKFSRKAVRDFLGMNNRAWQSGYTAIFQGMRDDHPGGAPAVGDAYSDVFHRVSQGTYELSAKGCRMAKQLRLTEQWDQQKTTPNNDLQRALTRDGSVGTAET